MLLSLDIPLGDSPVRFLGSFKLWGPAISLLPFIVVTIAHLPTLLKPFPGVHIARYHHPNRGYHVVRNIPSHSVCWTLPCSL